MQGKPGTPISLLHELAKSSEYLCLASLTEYPYTPLEVLEKIVISQWRYEQQLQKTRRCRPDLLNE
jgi:hypothetical protein